MRSEMDNFSTIHIFKVSPGGEGSGDRATGRLVHPSNVQPMRFFLENLDLVWPNIVVFTMCFSIVLNWDDSEKNHHTIFQYVSRQNKQRCNPSRLPSGAAITLPFRVRPTQGEPLGSGELLVCSDSSSKVSLPQKK